MRYALALLAVLATSAGCGGRARSSVDWEHRAAFAKGTVLRHVPAECAGGHVFIDLPAVETNEASRAAFEVLAARFLAGMETSTTDRKVLAALRDSLREEGLDPSRDTKELAICLRGSGGIVAVLGGEYSGKDVFRAFEKAAKKLGDKTPRIENQRGIEYIELGQLRVARIAPNVIAVGEDLSALIALGSESDRSAAWGYRPGLAGFARMAGDDEMFVSFAGTREEVEIEVIVRSGQAVKDLEGRRSGIADRLADTPLKKLAPAASAAQINSTSGFARFVLRGKSADVAEAIHTAAELSPAELKKVIGYVFGGTDGTGTPEHKI